MKQNRNYLLKVFLCLGLGIWLVACGENHRETISDAPPELRRGETTEAPAGQKCFFEFDDFLGKEALSQTDSMPKLCVPYWNLNHFLREVPDTSLLARVVREERASGSIRFVVRKDGSTCCFRPNSEREPHVFDEWVFRTIREKSVWEPATCEGDTFDFLVHFKYHL